MRGEAVLMIVEPLDRDKMLSTVLGKLMSRRE